MENIYAVPTNVTPSSAEAPRLAICGHKTRFATKLFCQTVYGQRVRVIEIPATNNRPEQSNHEVRHDWCASCLEKQTRLCALCGDAIFVGDHMSLIYFEGPANTALHFAEKGSVKEFLNPLGLAYMTRRIEEAFKHDGAKIWEVAICSTCPDNLKFNPSVLLPGDDVLSNIHPIIAYTLEEVLHMQERMWGKKTV